MRRDVAASTASAPYSVRLPGPGLGEVAVADVIDFLRGVSELVAYAAHLRVARPLGLPGRRGAAIEGATKLRLVGLSNGSLVADIAPAPRSVMHESLGLDVASLSEESLGAVFDVIEGREAQPELASAVIAFADRMRSRREGLAVAFIDRRGLREVVTELDDETIHRLQIVAHGPVRSATHLGRVTGRLYEANVESDEAHLRTPSGEAVKVEFDHALEPEIKRLLGDPASLLGEVEYDPRSRRIREIRARSIDSGFQMTFDGVVFWNDPTLTDLAMAVGAQPVEDPNELHFDATDQEWDDLYSVLVNAE